MTVPETIVKLTNLTSLNLRANRMPTVPSPVVSLKSLVRLDLSGNNLVTLPPGLKNLTNLTDLRLSRNKLTTLPVTLAQLPVRPVGLVGPRLHAPHPNLPWSRACHMQAPCRDPAYRAGGPS